MLSGLVPGTLDILILKVVSDEPNHGYGVARHVREFTDGEVSIEDGALYTALHRLETRGLLRSTWKRSDTNRVAKYYAITASGRKALAQQTAQWRRSAQALSRIVNRRPKRQPS